MLEADQTVIRQEQIVAQAKALVSELLALRSAWIHDEDVKPRQNGQRLSMLIEEQNLLKAQSRQFDCMTEAELSALIADFRTQLVKEKEERSLFLKSVRR